MKKLKILLAIRSLDFGGAERQWVLLAKEFAKRDDIELHLCTLYGGGRLEYEILGIPHTCLQKKGRKDFGFLKRYYRTIKQFDPDCIYAFMPEMNIFSLICAIPLRKKVVFGLRSSAINVSKLPFASKLYFYTQKFLSPFANAIICNANDALEFYKQKGYHTKKMQVVHNGIDTQRFFIRDSKSLKKEIGISENAFVFGISARMNRVKNYPFFAQVVREFLESLEAKGIENLSEVVTFISLGKCEEKTLKECLNILGKYKNAILFLGAKNDIERYYPIFDSIVSTSTTESFSNSIAEGMACGCVPIVSNVGESKVIADFNQKDYTFCFEANDKLKALECFHSLFALRNTQTLLTLKQNCKEHIKAHFSPESMVENTLHILREL